MTYLNAIRLKDQNGVAYGVKHVSNKPRVSAMPYLYDIAEGNIAGHTEFERFGLNPDIDTAVEEDVWIGGGNYVFPSVEQQMELVSSSGNDAAEGSGIQQVILRYLDDAFAEKTETITLNGVTPVATVATDIFRVQSLKAVAVGAGGVAAGLISIRHLSDSPIYSQISAGQTRSRNSIYTVPAGKTLYLVSFTGGVSGGANFTALLTLRATYDHEVPATRTFFLPHAEMMVGSGSGGFDREFEIPLKFPAGVDIKVSATATNNNTTVIAALRGWLE